MFIDAVMEKSWWGHAILYSTKTRNRISTARFDNKKTPFQSFQPRQVDLNIFKPFACTALIYFPMENQTKIDVTTDRGTVVGLNEVELFYTVYNHARKRILQTRDVMFI